MSYIKSPIDIKKINSTEGKKIFKKYIKMYIKKKSLHGNGIMKNTNTINSNFENKNRIVEKDTNNNNELEKYKKTDNEMDSLYNYLFK